MRGWHPTLQWSEMEAVMVNPETELLLRLQAMARWCQHASDGRTDPEEALRAVKLLLEAAVEFQRQKEEKHE